MLHRFHASNFLKNDKNYEVMLSLSALKEVQYILLPRHQLMENRLRRALSIPTVELRLFLEAITPLFLSGSPHDFNHSCHDEQQEGRS